MFGTCKLCLLYKDRQESHFLPAGLYRLLVNDENPNPILMTSHTSMYTSKQMRDYVFCAECEKLFDQGGEDYSIPQMKGPNGFPLLERLNVAMPIDHSFNDGVYLGERVGIDTKKLAYFAISVAYRSAVHTWPSIRNHVPDQVDLGTWREPIRLFLLGGSFPEHMTVLTTACKDWFSQNVFYAPTKILGVLTPGISFLACGIHFLILLGTPEPSTMADYCTHKMDKISVAENGQRTIKAYAHINQTSTKRGLLAQHYPPNAATTSSSE